MGSKASLNNRNMGVVVNGCGCVRFVEMNPLPCESPCSVCKCRGQTTNSFRHHVITSVPALWGCVACQTYLMCCVSTLIEITINMEGSSCSEIYCPPPPPPIHTEPMTTL